MPKQTNGGTIDGTAPQPSPAPQPGTRHGDPDDEVLAALLIRMWALASGRTLRSDVPPDQLSPEELIAFWADDMTTYRGRHVRPDGPALPPRTPLLGRQPGKAPRPRRRKRRNPTGKGATGRPGLPADPAAAH